MCAVGGAFLLLVLCAVFVLRSFRPPESEIPAAYLRPQFDQPPNVVLISLDTLRADHLGCYGYARNTSPNIDRLADRSMVFLNAYTAAPATAESHMSMFTSLYPSVHKVRTTVRDKEVHVLDESIITLPRILKNHGYTTVGFHGGGHVDERYGFGRGFDTYLTRRQEQAEGWLQRHASDNKFFLFYHTYHVHDPYMPGPPYDTMFDPDYKGKMISDRHALSSGNGKQGTVGQRYWKLVDKTDPADIAHLSALYDGLIAELDNELGKLLAAIDQYAPETIIIVLSDHGEAFGEHGDFLHGRHHREILQVPLIIRLPGAEHGVRVETAFSLVDLAPTILDMLSIPLMEQFQGKALMDLVRGPAPKFVFAEFPITSTACVIASNGQLTRHGRHEQFSDMGTGGALTDADRRLLRIALDRFIKRNQRAAAVFNQNERKQRLKLETIKRLKQLGYIK